MGKRERKSKRRSSSTVSEDESSWVMIAFWAVVALVCFKHAAAYLKRVKCKT